MISPESRWLNNEQRARAREVAELEAAGKHPQWNWTATLLIGIWAMTQGLWRAFVMLLWTSKWTYVMLLVSLALVSREACLAIRCLRLQGMLDQARGCSECLTMPLGNAQHEGKVAMKQILLTGCLATLVLLAISNTQAALISDFDDGTMQGWSKGDPLNLGSFGGTLSLVSSGGNPGGYLRATDTVVFGGSLAALAPTSLAGDLTPSGGLSWDVLLPSGAVLSTSVRLEGHDGTFFQSDNTLLATQPKNAWFTKTVDFASAAGWHVQDYGTASFASVVSNTKALYIELDVTAFTTIEAGMDNVRTTIPEPTTIWPCLFGAWLLCCSRRRFLKSVSGGPVP